MALFDETVWRTLDLSPSRTYPDPRTGHGALYEARSGLLYVIGGFNQHEQLRDMWTLHAETLQWSPVRQADDRDSPLPRIMFRCAWLTDKIALFGGVCGDGVYNDLWTYDIPSRAWERLCEEAPAPERCNHGMVSLGPRILIYGGDGIHTLGDLWLYDSEPAQWTCVCPSGPTPGVRTSHCLEYSISTSTVFLFGGMGRLPMDDSPHLVPMNDLWVLQVASVDTSEWQWTQVSFNGFAPSPRALAAMTVSQHGLFLVGGYGYKEEKLDHREVEEPEYVRQEDDNEKMEDTESAASRGIEPVSNLVGSEAVLAESGAGVVSTTETEQQTVDDTVQVQEQDSATLANEAIGQEMMEVQQLHEEVEDEDEIDEYKEGEEDEDEAEDEEDEDEDEDEGVVEGFLDDIWAARLSDLTSLDLSSDVEGATRYAGPSRNGLTVTTCGRYMILFGGFNGETFFNRVDVGRLTDIEAELSSI